MDVGFNLCDIRVVCEVGIMKLHAELGFVYVLGVNNRKEGSCSEVTFDASRVAGVPDARNGGSKVLFPRFQTPGSTGVPDSEFMLFHGGLVRHLERYWLSPIKGQDTSRVCGSMGRSRARQ